MSRAAAKKRRQPPVADEAAPRASAWLNVTLAATTLASAWLLFQVQPMVAKRILPWFGGGTAVWTTTMLFFQTALFAGYLYAHLATRLLRPTRQVAVHAVLLMAAVAALAVVGVVPADAWKPAGEALPAAAILAMLAACVGLPYLMLAATAPLVQVWFARANPGRTPYRLYALSNLGSLAALVTYPLWVEPNLGVASQGVAWSALFAVFVALCAASGFLALRTEATPADFADAPTDAPGPDDSRPPWLQVFFWLALPATASVLLLAITTYLCQDVASIPLLWIAPMIAYLLSFILTFESSRWYSRRFWLPAMILASFAVTLSWYYDHRGGYLAHVALNLGALFTFAMVCHGELAGLRPPPRRLTTFYLCIAAGGAIGGLLVGIVAPLVLADYYELPLAILAVWLLAIAVTVTDPRSAFYDGRSFFRLAGWALLTIALAAGMGAHWYHNRSFTRVITRNFYGVLKVRQPPAPSPELAYRQLSNGHISHGIQFRDPGIRRIPTQYYHPHSGVGLVLAAKHEQPRRVGVIGLGIGTLAAYADPDEEFVFYEINPRVIELAESQFTMLSDARARGADVPIVLGDARLSLEREPPRNFDVLVVDAFNSDAIPAHLLTREAIELYLRHLKPDGVLALHVSNMYMKLSLVALAAAEEFDLDAAYVNAPEGEQAPIGSRSFWALLHRRPGYFAERNLGAPLVDEAQGLRPVVWTDDFNNVFELLTLGKP